METELSYHSENSGARYTKYDTTFQQSFNNYMLSKKKPQTTYIKITLQKLNTKGTKNW